jgi:hypothetical protein
MLQATTPVGARLRPSRGARHCQDIDYDYEDDPSRGQGIVYAQPPEGSCYNANLIT